MKPRELVETERWHVRMLTQGKESSNPLADALETALDENERLRVSYGMMRTDLDFAQAALAKAEENDALSRSMLAKQCDLAREAEGELAEVKKKLDAYIEVTLGDSEIERDVIARLTDKEK